MNWRARRTRHAVCRVIVCMLCAGRVSVRLKSLGRRVLSNVALLTWGCIALLGASAAAAAFSKDWTWFSRSGALVAMAGILLGARPMVRLSFADWLDKLNRVDGGTLGPASPEEELEEREEGIDAIAAVRGVVLALSGAGINAYGDLLIRWATESARTLISR